MRVHVFRNSPSSAVVNNLSFLTDDLPLQHSYGVSWNIAFDTFTFQILDDKNAFSVSARKRGASKLTLIIDICHNASKCLPES